MQITAKRSVAIAVAGLVVGTVAALSVPALADNAPATPNATKIPAMTLDFAGTNGEADSPQVVGATFGGRAVVKDTSGNKVGEAFDVCAKDAINTKSDVVFCTGTINTKEGKISFSATLPISDDAANPERAAETGVVNGGTGSYEGVTGQVTFTPRAQGVFDATFS
ncbi:hypothetical protein E6W39_22720 [Kitasatospora acidiphila]|uniref:Uncharacterized protein n=1 Tax=Kitasatospora acidiphila TaxID=2567942 RepID=A0A540W670_9ACTN|nr:hypothetical protein [Kitasatospora acidiphila]TQF04525.1 hypothetical protein E6W39_22720 [Kitasatospora acidiphila]